MSVPNPSLCIPRAFVNTDEARVLSVFNQLNLGKISRIDIVERKNERGEPYKRVFIHFVHWFNNRDANAAMSKILEGKELKIVYDGPWFWKVSLNRYGAPLKPAAFKPHIDWSDDKPKSVPSHLPIVPTHLPVAMPTHLPPQPIQQQPPQKQRPNKVEQQAYNATVQKVPAPTQKAPATVQKAPNKYNKQQKASVTDQSAALPVKKRILTKKTQKQEKSEATSKATSAAKKQVASELEDGEVNELEVALSDKDQQLADALYGDI
jgi:hypothetical protein